MHYGICEIGLFEPHQEAQIRRNPVFNSRVYVEHDINMWGQWLYQEWIRCKRVALIHRGRVTHMRVTIIGCDNDLSPGRSQAINYLNQSCNIVNWTLKNKFQWTFNRNWYISIRENKFENVVWKMASIKCLCLNVFSVTEGQPYVPIGLVGSWVKTYMT